MKYCLIILLLLGSCLKSFCCDQFKTVKDTLGADSVVIAYYGNCQLFYLMPYKNGKQNGWSVQYHENGQLWTRELMINVKARDGYYEAYQANGKLGQSGIMKDGMQVGKWNQYDNSGRLSRIWVYDKRGRPKYQLTWRNDCNCWEKGGWL